MRFILRSRRESRRTTNASKITIKKREAKDNIKEAKETKVKTKKTKVDAKVNAKVDAKVATTTITTNKKQLSKLYKQFACIYINLILETTQILLSCLLLFDNSREYTSNTLYNQRLIKFSN